MILEAGLKTVLMFGNRFGGGEGAAPYKAVSFFFIF